MEQFLKLACFFVLFVNQLHAQTCRNGYYPMWMRSYGSDVNALIESVKDFDINYNDEVVSIGRITDPLAFVGTPYMSFVRLTETSKIKDRWFHIYVCSPATSLPSITETQGLDPLAVKF